MKSLNSAPLKFSIPVLVLSVLSCSVIAQKLPNVQKEGVLAPANVKMDGKASEWPKFEAYNHHTLVYYTLANDQDKLYMIVQAKDSVIVKKILNGGITLSITNSNQTTTQSVTYPLLSTYGLSGITEKMNNPQGDVKTEMAAVNQQLAASSKEMDVRGFKGIADTMISIYNEHGIRAKVTIDSKKLLTYELSIPLKYLQTSIDDNASFRYSVRLNGLPSRNIVYSGISKTPDQVNSNDRVYVLTPQPVSGGAAFVDVMSPTYFSGAYTLVKK